MSCPVPWPWKKENIKAMKLMADGTKENVEFTIADGRIEPSAEAGTPYKIIHNK